MIHAPKGILALDPGYAVNKHVALVYIEPFDDGEYDVDWVAFKPRRDGREERMTSILRKIDTFASPYRKDIAVLTAYSTAYGGAALGLQHLIGMFRGWGWEKGLFDWWPVNDKKVKKMLTGNGNATKKQVYDTIIGPRQLWPGCPEQKGDYYDVSDAFALAYYVMDRRRLKMKDVGL